MTAWLAWMARAALAALWAPVVIGAYRHGGLVSAGIAAGLGLLLAAAFIRGPDD